MRKLMFFFGFTILIISGCSDQYDKAEDQSIAALNEFNNVLEHNELIVDSDDLDTVMEAIDNNLGKYLSGNYTRKIENDIRQSFKENTNYIDEPKTFSFFLTNSGKGFQFARVEVPSKVGIWNTLDDKVVGTEIWITLNTDIPEWPHDWNESGTLNMMKIDGEWKIDDASYSSGILETSMSRNRAFRIGR